MILLRKSKINVYKYENNMNRKIEKNKDLGVYLNKLIYNECNKHLLKNPE